MNQDIITALLGISLGFIMGWMFKEVYTKREFPELTKKIGDGK